MKVAVFGLGYVGVTAACCIAEQGHEVLGVDVNADKVARITAGEAPIVEPGIPEMLTRARAAGRLSAQVCRAEELARALTETDLAMVCVGTPSAPDGSHDMSFVAKVTRQIATALAGTERRAPMTLAFRSTFRPGTMDELIAPLMAQALGPGWQARVRLVYNPEFLREGSAVQDYFAPPKIVIGTADGRPDPALGALNAGLDAPVFVTGFREAEITKFVDNSWHAVKVAFANEVGRVCLSLGFSAAKVHEIFVSDTKLNISPYYMRPGGPFGGSCLPKDVRAFQAIACETGSNLPLVDSLLRSNDAHKHRLFEYGADGLAPGARVLVAGLAFKAGTDDLRESPNVDLTRKLLAAGYRVSVFDPSVDARMLVGANLGYAFSHLPGLEGLLVSQPEAEAGPFDRVLATNATIRQLSLPPGTEIRDLGALL